MTPEEIEAIIEEHRYPELRYGEASEAVLTLQTWLHLTGHAGPPNWRTGVLDAETLRVLRAFWDEHGIATDEDESRQVGVTKTTWTALDALLRARLPPDPRRPLRLDLPARPAPGETVDDYQDRLAVILRGLGVRIDASTPERRDEEVEKAILLFKRLDARYHKVQFGPLGSPRPALPNMLDATIRPHTQRRWRRNRETWGLFYGAPWFGITVHPSAGREEYVWATRSVTDALYSCGRRFLAAAENKDDLLWRLRHPITVLGLAAPIGGSGRADRSDLGHDVPIGMSPTVDEIEHAKLWNAWKRAIDELLPLAQTRAEKGVGADQVRVVTIPSTYEQVRGVFKYMVEKIKNASSAPGGDIEARRALVRAFVGELYTSTAEADLRRELPKAPFVHVIPGAVTGRTFRALVIAVGEGEIRASLDSGAKVPVEPVGNREASDTDKESAQTLIEWLKALDIRLLVASNNVDLREGADHRLVVELIAQGDNRILASAECQFATLAPQSFSKGLTFVVASCYYDYFTMGSNYREALRWLKNRKAEHDWPLDSAAFKLLIGDNLYLDVAPDIPDRVFGTSIVPVRPPARSDDAHKKLSRRWQSQLALLAWSEALGRYLRYWLTGDYAQSLNSLPTFTTWDDHEYWNDYPEWQLHLDRAPQNSGTAGLAEFRAAARACLRAFQLPLNPPLTWSTSGSLSYEFKRPRLATDNSAPQASFCVLDGRSSREVASKQQMTFDGDMQRLYRWATSLRGPGVFVFGQPLVIEPITYNEDFSLFSWKFIKQDHNPPFYHKEYGELWEALDAACWDVLVISGDVHHSRLIQVDTRWPPELAAATSSTFAGSPDCERTVWEFVTSPACHIPTSNDYKMVKHEQNRDLITSIPQDWMPPDRASESEGVRVKAKAAKDAASLRDKLWSKFQLPEGGSETLATQAKAATKFTEDREREVRAAAGFELAMWSNAQNTLGVVGIRPLTKTQVRVDLAFVDLENPEEIMRNSAATSIPPGAELFKDWHPKPRTSRQCSDGLPLHWLRSERDWQFRTFKVLKPWGLFREYNPAAIIRGEKFSPTEKNERLFERVRLLTEGELFNVMEVVDQGLATPDQTPALPGRTEGWPAFPPRPYQLLRVKMVADEKEGFLWGTYGRETCYKRDDLLLGAPEEWLGRWFKVNKPWSLFRSYDPGTIQQSFPGVDQDPQDLYPFGSYKTSERYSSTVPSPLPPVTTAEQRIRALQEGEVFTVRRVLYESSNAGPGVNGAQGAYQCLEVLMADTTGTEGVQTFLWGTYGGEKCYEPWDVCLHSVYLRRRFFAMNDQTRYVVTRAGGSLWHGFEPSLDGGVHIFKRAQIAPTVAPSGVVRSVAKGETFIVMGVAFQAEQMFRGHTIEGQYQCLRVKMEVDGEEGYFWSVWNDEARFEFVPPGVLLGNWTPLAIDGRHRLVHLGQRRLLDWVPGPSSSQYRVWPYNLFAPPGYSMLTALPGEGPFDMQTWSTITSSHELIWLGRDMEADPPAEHDLVLDWVPSTGNYRLYRVDSSGTKSDGTTPDILAEPPLATGNWTSIRSSKKLIYLGLNRVLEWEPATGKFQVWVLDRSASGTVDPQNDPLPTVEVHGTWQTIREGHRLLYLGGDRVLSWQPSTGWYRVWRYDRSVQGQGDPLGAAPLVEGHWQHIDESHELIWLGGEDVLDWEPGTGAFRRFDPDAVSKDPLP
ncbi:MAG: hypothetical protein IPK82_27520 [Polyangiaceae bacterium]|nr:hypothetical protein [Polyangiaceae bacterium]